MNRFLFSGMLASAALLSFGAGAQDDKFEAGVFAR
jgi:hypothetical protein